MFSISVFYCDEKRWPLMSRAAKKLTRAARASEPAVRLSRWSGRPQYQLLRLCQFGYQLLPDHSPPEPLERPCQLCQFHDDDEPLERPYQPESEAKSARAAEPEDGK